MNNKRKAIKALVWALRTDGDSHKHWYIEKALRFLGADLEKLAGRDGARDWEKGIPP